MATIFDYFGSDIQICADVLDGIVSKIETDAAASLKRKRAPEEEEDRCVNGSRRGDDRVEVQEQHCKVCDDDTGVVGTDDGIYCARIEGRCIEPFCGPMQERVPLKYVRHVVTKDEVTRKRRKNDGDACSLYHGKVIKYDLMPGRYFVRPYTTKSGGSLAEVYERIKTGAGDVFETTTSANKTKIIGLGTGERICLMLKDGTRKKIMKSHCVLSACWPDAPPNETVDHIANEHEVYTNAFWNLEWVTRAENSKRAHMNSSQRYKESRKKSAKSRGKVVIRIRINPETKTTEEVRFESTHDAARNTEGACHGSISLVANGKRKTCGGYEWRFEKYTHRRYPGRVRIVKKFPGDFSAEHQQIILTASNGGVIPKAVSNFAEILTRYEKWTTGRTNSRKSETMRFYGNVNVACWVFLFFHVDEWKSSLQINHKDGDETDVGRFHTDTHLDDGTYSNCEWTLYQGTQSQNMQDKVLRQRRLKRKPTTAEIEI